MALLPTPRVTTKTVASQYVYHFEIDADNMRIKVRAYDRETDGSIIGSSQRTSSWLEMFTDDTMTVPNLPQSEWAGFAAAMPLVTNLAIAFGKVGGVIDPDAVV